MAYDASNTKVMDVQMCLLAGLGLKSIMIFLVVKGKVNYKPIQAGIQISSIFVKNNIMQI